MKLKKLFSILGLKAINKERPFEYSEWISKIERPSFQRSEGKKSNKAILSVILIAHKINESVNQSITSLLNQTVLNWELYIVLDNIPQDGFVFHDKRINVSLKNDRFTSSQLANIAVQSTKGCLITFINEGDKLSEHAVEYITNNAVNNRHQKIIVTDEDLLDVHGQRCNPFFKPDWNTDYLQNYNYFSKAVVYDKEFFIDVGGFSGNEYDARHAFYLRVTKGLSTEEIGHISKILFHYRRLETGQIYKKEFDIPVPAPLVTIIIPTKDHVELLKVCINGLLNNTNYKAIEIIIIDNQSEQTETLEYLEKIKVDSTIRILNYDKPFNYSEMNNIAASEAKGSLLCFLNNDISIIEDNWLSEMVAHGCRPEIGCVGAKLFYPDGTIQHGGVILGLKGYASHAHKGFAGNDLGYFNRLIVTHNVSAVTAACMLVRKEVFDRVGGFDTKNLKVAYNDVDLCLKIREVGYRNLFTPHAQLIHHESKSRGKKRSKEQQKKLRREAIFLREKWGEALDADPAYNKNLTLRREDFSLCADRESL